MRLFDGWKFRERAFFANESIKEAFRIAAENLDAEIIHKLLDQLPVPHLGQGIVLCPARR